MLSLSGDIRDHILKGYKIDRNFACFWLSLFWGSALPEFLGLYYKVQPDSDHDVIKFHGDRLIDLGKSVAKKNICGKTEARPERPELTFHAA